MIFFKLYASAKDKHILLVIYYTSLATSYLSLSILVFTFYSPANLCFYYCAFVLKKWMISFNSTISLSLYFNSSISVSLYLFRSSTIKSISLYFCYSNYWSLLEIISYYLKRTLNLLSAKCFYSINRFISTKYSLFWFARI